MLRDPRSLSLFLGVLVAACTPDRPSPPPPPVAPSPPATVAAPTAVSIDPRLLSLKSLYTASASDPVAAGRLYAENATKRFGDLTELHGRAAIEASVKAEIAKLGAPAYAAGRAWIKGDTIVADEVVRAQVNGRSVGLRQLGVYWFDAAGLIATHHAYRNSLDVDAQLTGAPDAPPPAPLPASIETHVAQDSNDEGAAAALMGRFDLAFAKSTEAVSSLLTDDVTIECTMGAQSKGKAKYLELLQGFYKSFPDESYTIEHVWSVDDYLVVEHTMHATRAKTGKPMTMPTGEVFRVVDGKIAADWVYIDPASFVRP